jgi:hypothetical protein
MEMNDLTKPLSFSVFVRNTTYISFKGYGVMKKEINLE